MEPDFVTRNHTESINVTNDPQMFELLNKYKFPPSNPQMPPQPQPHSYPQFPMGTFPVNFGGNPDTIMLSNMIGQLQGTLNQQQFQQKSSGLGGLNLNVDSDVLKWLLLLVILAILIWLILKVKTGRRKNPMLKRMKKMEKEMKMLRKNPELLALHKKTKLPLPDLDTDVDSEDEYIDEDDDQ